MLVKGATDFRAPGDIENSIGSLSVSDNTHWCTITTILDRKRQLCYFWWEFCHVFICLQNSIHGYWPSHIAYMATGKCTWDGYFSFVPFITLKRFTWHVEKFEILFLNILCLHIFVNIWLIWYLILPTSCFYSIVMMLIPGCKWYLNSAVISQGKRRTKCIKYWTVTIPISNAAHKFTSNCVS